MLDWFTNLWSRFYNWLYPEHHELLYLEFQYLEDEKEPRILTDAEIEILSQAIEEKNKIII